jgi:ubiquinone/menaquinone biosynthesis C-methylase UbiE
LKSCNDDKIILNNYSNEFEQVYIDLRCHEKRLYTDEEVAWLPDIADDHVHKKEWEIRKASCKQLIKYLGGKNKPLKILEVGCGNGWLSYQLSQISCSNVVGLDVNLIELQQAERVFCAIPNLNFICSDLGSLSGFEKFDSIVFAASIQYFASFTGILEAALDRLKDSGEIHIIDSHFYYETDVEAARQRSHHYFHSKGFDSMDNFYFHHTLKELEGFSYTILYDPNTVFNKILRRKNHFHWICIKK